MKSVHKYRIVYDDAQQGVILKMPLGAEILHIGQQGNEPMLWALVDPKMPLTEYKLKLFGTGFEMPERYTKADYVGTVFIGPLVWHFFNAKD